MKADKFRELAMEMPEAEESSHHNHPDFRVAGKVFATIGPDGDWAMVKVPVEEQSKLMARDDAFEPFTGAWGKQGCTRITLKSAKIRDVREALLIDGFKAVTHASFAETMAWDRDANAQGYAVPA